MNRREFIRAGAAAPIAVTASTGAAIAVTEGDSATELAALYHRTEIAYDDALEAASTIPLPPYPKVSLISANPWYSTDKDGKVTIEHRPDTFRCPAHLEAEKVWYRKDDVDAGIAKLKAMREEYDKAEQAARDTCRVDEFRNQWNDLRDELAETPAASLHGIFAKVGVLLSVLHGSGCLDEDSDGPLLESVHADPGRAGLHALAHRTVFSDTPWDWARDSAVVWFWSI